MQQSGLICDVWMVLQLITSFSSKSTTQNIAKKPKIKSNNNNTSSSNYDHFSPSVSTILSSPNPLTLPPTPSSTPPYSTPYIPKGTTTTLSLSLSNPSQNIFTCTPPTTPTKSRYVSQFPWSYPQPHSTSSTTSLSSSPSPTSSKRTTTTTTEDVLRSPRRSLWCVMKTSCMGCFIKPNKPKTSKKIGHSNSYSNEYNNNSGHEFCQWRKMNEEFREQKVKEAILYCKYSSQKPLVET